MSSTGGLVPLCIGATDPATTSKTSTARAHALLRQRPSPLADPQIDWQAHGVEPRWLGWETSSCAATLDPTHAGTTELSRYFEGAKQRGEIAIVVATLGRDDADLVRGNLLNDMPPSVSLAGHGFIQGRPTPKGTLPELAAGPGRAERDLGLRLRNSRTDAAWWSLALGSQTLHGTSGHSWTEHTDGDLHPVLVDSLGEPVVAVWLSPDKDQRWYIVPYDTDWNLLLDWLITQALPQYVPAALYRARSPLHVDPDLQTSAELSARRALAAMATRHADEQALLEADLAQAQAAAVEIRHGLLYGTGTELVNAVSTVLTAAGFTTFDLDATLGDTRSADLLATIDQQRRLIEVKSASGAAAERLALQLQGHLQTWPGLRPHEPVGGGALIVNHQYRDLPSDRSPQVYSRPEFVATLPFPVIGTRALFDWWRANDWEAIRQAILGAASPAVPSSGPGQPRNATPDPGTSQTASPPRSRARPRIGRWRHASQ